MRYPGDGPVSINPPTADTGSGIPDLRGRVQAVVFAYETGLFAPGGGAWMIDPKLNGRRRSLTTALGLLRGELAAGPSPIAELTAQDAWLGFLRFSRQRPDPALVQLGSFDSWFFHDTDEDLDQWAAALADRLAPLRGRVPVGLRLYEEPV
ncbi:hypothetical protein [Streptomyces sp. NPDC021622]|uniref:hypothetical protein n=1 Tax=Streptomyces sp. NPDC021622 TaxID=3155013 RepID=UPI0033D3FDC0